MLERAVTALKANQADALDKFQSGRAGFKDRDLYVFCIGPDRLWSAHPSLKGQHVRTWITRDGRVVGEEMLESAREGTVSETTYPWVRPGAMVPVPKTTYFTRVGDQVCGVGFLK
jgi:hypothetical protein